MRKGTAMDPISPGNWSYPAHGHRAAAAGDVLGHAVRQSSSPTVQVAHEIGGGTAPAIISAQIGARRAS